MTVPRKLVALASGAVLALTASMIAPSYAQQPAAAPNASETLLIDNATFEFIEKSDVSPLTEGVIEKLELEIGKTVKKGGEIGSLYKKKAELMVKKAKTAAASVGPLRKAEAQRDQALTVVARNRRLLSTSRSFVSREDADKAEADLLVTEAMIQEAKENQAVATADLELAENTLSEHTIHAPFTGVIMKRLKNPGESVKSNEPVIELGNLDKLRVFAFVPLESSFRLSEGSEVEFQLTVRGRRGGAMAIEQKKFRGVVSFIDPQIQPEVETEVRIYADFNNESHELKPGMKGTLTLFLNPPGAAPARRAAAPDREAAVAPAPAPAADAEPVVPTSATATAPGSASLPPLPR
jgi:RND family efflux transporter MFP subunit